jgi:uncharacterized protein (DUF488 family)
VKDIWTIGHSTHPMDEFLTMLKSFDIEVLVDIRTYPGSRRYPHFNKENLLTTLSLEKIRYEHFVDLGGRRKPAKDSINTAWRHPAFRGYADHMQSAGFTSAVSRLETIAEKFKTAYMCSEATWWRCHRALLSDFLKARGWNVYHIMAQNKSTPHPYTSPAKIVQGELFYND